MESIHAIVNALANQFAALDKSRRCTQVLRVLASRKTRSMDVAVEKKDKYGDSVNVKKRKRVQGQNKKVTGPKQEINYGDCCFCCGSEAREHHRGFHGRVRQIRCM